MSPAVDGGPPGGAPVGPAGRGTLAARRSGHPSGGYFGGEQRVDAAGGGMLNDLRPLYDRRAHLDDAVIANAGPHAEEVHAPRTLIIGCAALVRELGTVLAGFDRTSFDLELLPAPLHNHPERIPERIGNLLSERAGAYDRIVVAYGDCGTGGRLDTVLERFGAVRLPGAHCYEFFGGSDVFASLDGEEAGTFYLTDFLARHFHTLIYAGLGLDRHPELRDQYFGNYRRLVLLSQSDDPDLIAIGERAAALLGLTFEHRHVGLTPFAAAITSLLESPPRPVDP